MKIENIKEYEVKPQWMVLFRHFGMEGGVYDYGVAEIIGFYDSEKEANNQAEKIIKLSRNKISPNVWVTKCVRTYQHLNTIDNTIVVAIDKKYNDNTIQKPACTESSEKFSTEKYFNRVCSKKDSAYSKLRSKYKKTTRNLNDNLNKRVKQNKIDSCFKDYIKIHNKRLYDKAAKHVSIVFNIPNKYTMNKQTNLKIFKDYMHKNYIKSK